MVVNLVLRRRSCKTIGGEDIWKLGEEVGDTLWGGEEIGMEESDGGGKEVSVTEGEDLLKTFWLATSWRRL